MTAYSGRTQAHSGASAPATDVYVGLDFGTAFTKAAVEVFDSLFVVDWDDAVDAENRFLLPTEFTCMPEGRCFLGRQIATEPQRVFSGLKQPFISGSPSDEAFASAATFLALTLNHVRAWLLAQQSKKLARYTLRWSVNIGVPCDALETTKMHEQYERLVRLAWGLSLLSRSDISVERARDWVISRVVPNGQDLAEVDTTPEFVAQLASYVKSPQRRSGLHFLVDIGGGTVDMVTFNVYQSGDDDLFPFFVPRVDPMGTYSLMASRMALCGESSRIAGRLHELLAAERFAQVSGVRYSEVQKHDGLFFGELGQIAAGVLRKTRATRYRMAPEWNSELRTFVTGGGSRLVEYSKAVSGCPVPGTGELKPFQLPLDARLEGIPDDLEYDRVSVACGLARNALSLGQIRPATRVEDDKPTSLPRRDLPTHDELYAR